MSELTTLPDQNPFFEITEFAENADQRCPVILLLDTSTSMVGKPIEQVNEGFRIFLEDVVKDSLAAKRVDVSVITFGPVEKKIDFCNPSLVNFREFEANGLTPIGEALNLAMDTLEDRKKVLKENGIQYYRPWIFLITDGAPTDKWQDAAKRLKSEEDRGKFTFFAVGVKDACMETLDEISQNRPALKLDGLKFREFFLWLSRSSKKISHSRSGDKVAIEPPTTWVIDV